MFKSHTSNSFSTTPPICFIYIFTPQLLLVKVSQSQLTKYYNLHLICQLTPLPYLSSTTEPNLPLYLCSNLISLSLSVTSPLTHRFPLHVHTSTKSFHFYNLHPNPLALPIFNIHLSTTIFQSLIISLSSTFKPAKIPSLLQLSTYPSHSSWLSIGRG